MSQQPYRGRIAPSPTGHLHLGHARTFWIAQQRARAAQGTLVLRNEDLDSTRYQMEFVEAMIEDLKWFGLDWQEGPDRPDTAGFGPYQQSERMNFYRAAMEKLVAGGLVYPCVCSRKDIQAAVRAPHAEDDEPVYPGTCRAKSEFTSGTGNLSFDPHSSTLNASWRLRVPDGEAVSFVDGRFGRQQFVAGKDFGDFIVWRRDGVPAYQLVCVVDDAAMQITEVVRGADLLLSTARQLLLFRALGLMAPAFYHCDLMKDEGGVRLAKRHEALSLRALRGQGKSPEELRAGFGQP